MHTTHTLLSIDNVIQEMERNKEEILSLFEFRMKHKVPVPEELTNEIVTIIPKQLELLIHTLIRCSASGEPVNTLARAHAKMRLSQKTFTLEILIAEFIVLKDVIFEVLEKKGEVDTKASNLIWNYILNAIRVSVTEFERERQEEAETLSSRLNESDELNERIKAEITQSRENEERYRSLVEGLVDYAVFTVDAKGFILSWNPGAERMKGYSSDEVIGKHFSMLYPEEGIRRDEPMQHLHDALIDGSYHGEGIRRRKSGELFLADVYIRPVYRNGKHLGFAKVVADVTERDKLLRNSAQKNVEIRDLKSEKELRQSFVMTLVHDLRGPLSVIRASGEILRRNMDPSEKLVRFADKIILGVDRTNRMIGDLLDANRMIAGEEIALRIHDWDLIRLTKNVIDDYSILGKDVRLHTESSALMGRWDGEGLRRILENLIGNAVKYGSTHCPVNVTVKDLGDEVSIEVQNTGEVISPEDQLTLFDQFRRTPSALRGKKGWGIGLSLVKGITEAHGGAIQVMSDPVQGTKFTVTIPKMVTES